MKERTKNSLGYCALLTGALLLGVAMMAGSYSLYAKSLAPSMDDAKNQKFNQSTIRYAEQLQISNNPRDLVVAALFLDFQNIAKNPYQKPKPAQIELLKKAIALSPNDTDIAWLEAMGCGNLKAACNSENAIERLKQAEPDNLAVHLLAFNQADMAGNNALRLSAVQAMANSRYSNIHYLSIGSLVNEAFRGWYPPIKISASEMFGDDINQAPVTDDEARKIVAMGYGMAIGMPALQQITTYCKTEKMPVDQLQDCQKIATVMIKDKTLIMYRIGLRIGVEVFNQEPAASQWREAYRVSSWQLSGHGQNPDAKTKFSERKYFNAWPSIDEIKQQQQRLIDQGIPLLPPDGWMPESEEIRKLLRAPVTTKP